MQRKTSSRGASKTRLNRSSFGASACRRAHPRSASLPLSVAPSRAGAPLQVGQQRVELVEALVPQAPVRADPVQRAVERLDLEVAGPELGVAPREIRPLRSSTLRCLEIPGSDMSKGAASSPTVASPRASRLTMARRVGSASAANAASSRSSVIVMACI